MLLLLCAVLPSNALSLHSRDQRSTVTYGTMFTIGHDKLPLAQMLSHQLRGLSSEGRDRFDQVLVYVNGLSYLPKAVPDDLAKALLTVSGEARLLDEKRLTDRAFFSEYLEDEHASTLDQMGFQHGGSRMLAMLTFLADCQATYCVWMDPDIFVHRNADGPGWVDFGMATLDQTKSRSVMSFPFLSSDGGEEESQNCTLFEGQGLSERWMMVHKERFMKEFPMRLACAPNCNYFEQQFSAAAHGDIVVGTLCPQHSFWAVHPSRSSKDIMEILRSCATDKYASEDEITRVGLKIVLQHVEGMAHRRSREDSHFITDFCKFQAKGLVIPQVLNGSFRSPGPQKRAFDLYAPGATDVVFNSGSSA